MTTRPDLGLLMASFHPRFWRPWQLELLRRRYADHHTEALARVLGRPPKKIYTQAIKLGLHKSRDFIAEMTRQAMLDPSHGGRRAQFTKGMTPMNKGVKRGRGWAPGRMAEGQFKPGFKPHTWVPVGSYRVVHNKNGGPELQRKVSDDPGPSAVRWKPVHRLVWEAEHGPPPDDHIIVFKPGMRTTDAALITVDRLDCITRQELMRRNTIHNLPPEFAEVARLKAALAKAITARERKDGRQADAP